MTMLTQNYQLIPSSSIDDQKIMLLDWNKHVPGLTQPKVVVPDPTFPLRLSSWKRFKLSIGSFQRYLWSMNSAIWLVEAI